MGPAQTRRLSFSTPIMALSTLQKHVLKGKCPIDAKILQNVGQTKGQMVPFSRMHIPICSCFPAVLCSGNPRNLKNPSLPCASLEPELHNSLIRICGPRTPQNMQQTLVCNWCGRGFCVIPPQLILQTFFCVIDYAECHYTFLRLIPK